MCRTHDRLVYLVLFGAGVLATAMVTLAVEPAPSELSKYMNSIPPSRDYFCVGNGPTATILHPDRAPYTQLAMQSGVVLFSGAAPQQGVNFSLSAGSLIYRNQMSTLGSSEPSPQVGTAGTLLQRADDDNFLPWTEARWHPGEDITWSGYRGSAQWLGGMPYWDYPVTGSCSGEPTYAELADDVYIPAEDEPYKPWILVPANGDTWGMHSAINLQLCRGIYQLSKVRGDFEDSWNKAIGEAPYEFREPWFQGRGIDPAFNVKISDGMTTWHMANNVTGYFPNFLNIYPYTKLQIDGGRMMVDFERSATWPRLAAEDTGRPGVPVSDREVSGAVMASQVQDEYGNLVTFDRVPAYGWETDYKVPPRQGMNICESDPQFGALPAAYDPTPNAWRLPHKRMRTVQLTEATAVAGGDPTWTVMFVYEHPESDRISATDTTDDSQWKSLYSHLPQSNWKNGRLPDLNDETTLLTVQAYKSDLSGVINGAPFQDDYSVWGTIEDTENPNTQIARRLNYGPEYDGDYNNDGCPGICGVDDDGDGEIDEGGLADDDNEDGFVEEPCDSGETGCDPGEQDGLTEFYTSLSNPATDPTGDANGDGCPGLCGVDDDGDGLVDEDTSQYLPYLALSGTDCSDCQYSLVNEQPGQVDPVCFENGVLAQSTLQTSCLNPLYGKINGQTFDSRYDYFAHYDDDEDGLIDEDDGEDPLLVNLRALDGECAAGFHPYLPTGGTYPDGPAPDGCRNVYDAGEDPWTYQVQYVYARTNPYWLLSARNTETDPTNANYGRVRFLTQPQYYYFAPFSPDINGDGSTDDVLYDDGSDPVLESELVVAQSGDFAGMVVDSSAEGDNDGLPNVHPDCLPHPEFRGPQGVEADSGDDLPGVPPSDIHLIKRIVRMREDVTGNPNGFIEQVWLYRYNDFGFVKAVFDPAAVEAIIAADPADAIEEPDDILKYADTHIVRDTVSGGGHVDRPLISYASQWYTYYNPYIHQDQFNEPGIPPCYDHAPFVGMDCDAEDPTAYFPVNGCDGEFLWTDGYADEMQIDQDCSEFMRDDCGPCFGRYACTNSTCADDMTCTCEDGHAVSSEQLAQLGIPDAQPRFRKYLVKTARVRETDGAMHLYRFDYLGAASGIYSGGTITSYADPHNITIVDEMVEQTTDELENPGNLTYRNEFYIYEDNFRLDLDAAPSDDRPPAFSGTLYSADSHYLSVPAKVKTRRVVVMNYYGIAISDRLILTPGFMGDQTSLVDNQQYELTNTRGQLKQAYDPSWVATLRELGSDAVKNTGRVFVELFGGHEGWHSVLRGVAWGSGGGNLYDQQCRTPEVLEDVPVQRVAPEQVEVVSATKHYGRDGIGDELILDMPEVEAAFYEAPDWGTLEVNDPAQTVGGTLGIEGDDCVPETMPDCSACQDDAVPCTECVDCPSGDSCEVLAADEVDLKNQEPAAVGTIPGEDGIEGDGVSIIRYAYEFWTEAPDSDESERRVMWKYRWLEAVSEANGGTGNIALEMWYFDQNGRLRLYGRGSGTEGDPPTPATSGPFLVTYYGYDDFGRLTIQVDDIDPADLEGGQYDDILEINANDLEGIGPIDRIADGAPQNLVTYHKYNDLGMLVSRYVGFDSNTGTKFDLSTTESAGDDILRTDYALISNRVITYTKNSKTFVGWEDPYTYQLEYQGVSGLDGAAQGEVYGTTTVRVFDDAGRFVEQRAIAWPEGSENAAGRIKIGDFGWAISLMDYEYDGSIDSWSHDNIPYDLQKLCGNVPSHHCEGNWNLQDGISPNFPGDDGGPEDVWPPAPADRIITLSRSIKRYEQASTLKPTQDVVFRFFDQPDISEGGPRELIRRYAYDLEDRIARQQDPDGTVQRYLFDPKRRLTKVFRGSTDDCSDWFPVVTQPGAGDDMLLVEHRLYNDGLSSQNSTTCPAVSARCHRPTPTSRVTPRGWCGCGGSRATRRTAPAPTTTRPPAATRSTPTTTAAG